MYVVPFLMGPPGSRFSKVGVEITDSKYVVLSMRIMTRVGQVALDHLGASDDFTRCLHSLGDLSPERRFIMHFPEKNTVWSIGSGYGGNALLGKKCMALRLASWLAQEGRLAGRAHADPRARGSAEEDALHRRRVPVGVRQDQPGDAAAAQGAARAGRRRRSATTSRGCARDPTAGSMR